MNGLKPKILLLVSLDRFQFEVENIFETTINVIANAIHFWCHRGEFNFFVPVYFHLVFVNVSRHNITAACDDKCIVSITSYYC